MCYKGSAQNPLPARVFKHAPPSRDSSQLPFLLAEIQTWLVNCSRMQSTKIQFRDNSRRAFQFV